MAVGDTGRRRTHRVHYAFLAVHADVRLQTEIPLVPLLGLVHLRVALPGRILRRTRRMDDGSIDDRAGGDADEDSSLVYLQEQDDYDFGTGALGPLKKKTLYS